MADSLGAELGQKLSQPLKFQWSGLGAQPPTTIHGFDVTLLIDVCNAIIRVEEKLNNQQKHVARQAHLILSASAKSGIKGLVWALAGYIQDITINIYSKMLFKISFSDCLNWLIAPSRQADPEVTIANGEIL
jgi:hypothetical protein